MRRNKAGIDVFSIILMILAAFLLVIIVSVTIWAFSTGKVLKKTQNRSLFDDSSKNPPKEAVLAADLDKKTAIFTELGTLRAVTADANPVTVLISPFFPYPAEDIPFREELVQKSRILRIEVLDWFHLHTISEITKLGEIGVKSQLLEAINSHLILGKIEILYFEEYTVFD